MWQYQNTDELYHYGILGMKWGIRRYQNADGSYTNAGKKRYINDKTHGAKNTINNLKKINNSMTNNNTATITFTNKRNHKNNNVTFTKDQLNSFIKKTESVYNKKAAKYSKKWNNNSQVKKYRSSSADAKEAARISKKKLYQMSNKELSTLNNRKQLEYNYKLNNPSTAKKIMLGTASVAAAIGTINKLYKESDMFKSNTKRLAQSGKKIYDKVKNRVYR